MHMKRFIHIAGVALLGACAAEQPLAPESDAEIVARVLETWEAQLLILEAEPGGRFPSDPADCADKSLLRVGPEAGIYLREADGRLERAALSDIDVDDVIAVWIGPTELRSCPRQIFAERIEIIVPTS